MASTTTTARKPSTPASRKPSPGKAAGKAAQENTPKDASVTTIVGDHHGREAIGDNGGGRKAPAKTPATKPAPAKPAPTARAEDLPGTLSVLPVVGTLPDGTKVGRTYFYPQVIMKKAADTIKCGHEYLHENEKSAQACARKMQREGTFTPRNA